MGTWATWGTGARGYQGCVGKPVRAGCQEAIGARGCLYTNMLGPGHAGSQRGFIGQICERRPASSRATAFTGICRSLFGNQHPAPPALTKGPAGCCFSHESKRPQTSWQVSIDEFHEPLLSAHCIPCPRSDAGAGKTELSVGSVSALSSSLWVGRWPGHTQDRKTHSGASPVLVSHGTAPRGI